MALRDIEFKNTIINISYEIINPTKKKNIIILHGWGSNKEIMKQAFSKIMKEYRHIYIDMPGFGKSFNSLILTTQDYSDIIMLFLEKLKCIPLAIVGHSFGGKVATLLNSKNLILLSSAGIVEVKSAKTLVTIRMAKIFNRFGLGKVTKMLRSKDVHNMNQNMYETFKNVVDEDFSKEFEKVKSNTLIFWGEDDTSTTIESGKIISSLIINSKFKSYNGDHYFFTKYSDDICETIKKGIKREGQE